MIYVCLDERTDTTLVRLAIFIWYFVENGIKVKIDKLEILRYLQNCHIMPFEAETNLSKVESLITNCVLSMAQFGFIA